MVIVIEKLFGVEDEQNYCETFVLKHCVLAVEWRGVGNFYVFNRRGGFDCCYCIKKKGNCTVPSVLFNSALLSSVVDCSDSYLEKPTSKSKYQKVMISRTSRNFIYEVWNISKHTRE